ncbi:CDGSH iron-sulfur domain-containing protein [Hymenobacter endophyticus]|uniref:CDGSH iron-sulfur domain-containing protein n=1 Tax=Hymenobacter endophyticus TaxID=3076335 RepID=A0ABU3TK59_9BACT|nr:CDGSH iron-sulfur domain-containing protein [Hymenobacter endophyticus]MDU0371762.1 CDGSH iron-sulfur domain-containing protein [Hymenobacter endophyticus]
MATKLTVLSNGSLRVDGTDFELVDAQGNSYGLGGRERISICRCGLSKNKPFCDGSHKGHFEHNAEAFDLPAPKPATPPITPPATPDAGAAPLA